jgi:hypothetical protein
LPRILNIGWFRFADCNILGCSKRQMEIAHMIDGGSDGGMRHAKHSYSLGS